MRFPARITSPKQLADLRASSLMPETWSAAGLYTEEDAARLGGMLGWGRSARSLGPAMVFPYHGLDGELLDYFRVKPDNPRVQKDNGKQVKYEAPKGRPPHAYLPPQCHRAWRSGEPLLVVEGEKKALAGCQNGFPTIGLAGVWSWRRKGERELLPELRAIPWKDRRVYVVFDSDRESNPRVRQAEAALAAALVRLGADVRVVVFRPGPSGAKTGVDDFFARGGTPDQFRALLAAAKPVTAGGPGGYEFTDIGNGRRLADTAGRDLRFVADRGCWLAWDGRRWVERGAEVRVEAIAKDVLTEWAKAAAAAVGRAAKALAAAEADDAKERAKKALTDAQYELRFAKRSQDWRAVKRMIGAARSESAICISSYRETFDRHPWLLNCPNGTVDLRTGKLRPHAREDFMTKVAPVAYDPLATAPRYDRFLAEILGGRAELVGYIRRLSGVVCTGEVTNHTLHFFYGTGRNGKSVLLELWMDVLGPDEYALKLPDGVLVTAAIGARHPTELADLAGVRLAVANETEQDAKLAESRVKELTGGDTISARKMKQDFFRFAPTHKLIIASNHKPRVRGTDVGIWSRIRVVPFQVRFWTDEEREGDPDLRADPELKAKLMAEAPGVLADMVRMAGEFFRSELVLTAPKVVTAATREYQQAEDTLGEFFSERVVPDTDAAKEPKHRNRVTGADLYQAYRRWAEGRGEKVCGTVNFGEYAKKRLDHRKSAGVMCYFATVRPGPPQADELPDGEAGGEGGEGGSQFPVKPLKDRPPLDGHTGIDPHPPHPPQDDVLDDPVTGPCLDRASKSNAKCTADILSVADLSALWM